MFPMLIDRLQEFLGERSSLSLPSALPSLLLAPSSCLSLHLLVPLPLPHLHIFVDSSLPPVPSLCLSFILHLTPGQQWVHFQVAQGDFLPGLGCASAGVTKEKQLECWLSQTLGYCGDELYCQAPNHREDILGFPSKGKWLKKKISFYAYF